MYVKITIELCDEDFRVTCEGEEKYCAVFDSIASFVMNLARLALSKLTTEEEQNE